MQRYRIALLLLLSLVVLPACGLVDLVDEDLPVEREAPRAAGQDREQPEIALQQEDNGEPPADLIVFAQATATPAVVAPEGSPGVMAAYEGTLKQVYADVNPSVVNIQVVAVATAAQPHPDVPGYSFPLDPQEPQLQRGVGSGFIWDNNGHIVTNYHVIEGANQVAVTFFDGTTVPAEVIGTDPESDLAVLLIEVATDLLRPLPLADSTLVQVGELAIAIGNPFGLAGTMTVGIVSATGRSLPVQTGTFGMPQYTIPDIIQTDAPINPGNSGGVLVDEQGRLIGVTAAIESPVRANAGIGFAIPTVIVERVVPSLIETGSFQHPWLGIQGNTLIPDVAEAMNLDPRQRGALVVDVVPGGPADQAGLRGSDRQIDLQGLPLSIGGDVIIGIDDRPVEDFGDLVTYLAREGAVGEAITLTIIRDGQQQTLDLTLTARPGSQTAQQSQPRSQPQQQPGTGTAWIGITGLQVTPELAAAMDLPADLAGVLIEQVEEGSPAADAGLQGSFESADLNGQQVPIGGDIIVGFDGQPVASLEDLSTYLSFAAPGDRVILTIVRDGQVGEVQVELGERPEVRAP
jgi:serine protease Do